MYAASVFQARSAHMQQLQRVNFQAAFSFRYERLGSIMSYFFALQLHLFGETGR